MLEDGLPTIKGDPICHHIEAQLSTHSDRSQIVLPASRAHQIS
jgi:hypothetical protein